MKVIIMKIIIMKILIIVILMKCENENNEILMNNKEMIIIMKWY